MSNQVLVTGFAGYGGRGLNPSGEIARALDGREILSYRVRGQVLPVSYASLRQALQSLLDELQPRAVICLGLWPGEATIRLERIGINVADFEIPDNEGTYLTDVAINADGARAAYSTLPLREIESSLLKAGIPAHISATAGTFLCNATLYNILSMAQAIRVPPLAGFIHVPYLPEQVAELLALVRNERKLELHQRADMASMDLATMVRAVELALIASINTFR
jgi:pyroglutamyl-peptidase